MEKDRELRDESENTTSRREFLHHVAGAGLVVATALVPTASAAEPATRSRRTAGAATPFDPGILAGRYHIVSALVHSQEDAKHRRLLVLDWDSSNNVVMLGEAKIPTKGGKYQIWEVSTTGAIKNLAFAGTTNGYLGFNAANKLLQLVSQDDAMKGYDLNWYTGKLGDHVLIMTATGGVNSVLRFTAPSPDGTGNVSDKVVVGPLVIPDSGHSWVFVPTKDGIPGGGDQGGRASEGGFVLQTHVPDQCDSLWHNPSCPGNPATWTGCALVSGSSCNCTHSS